MKYPLPGRTVVVTGAGRGYGEHIALAVARAGANVVLASRTLDESAAVAEAIRAAGGSAAATRADVTSEAEVAALMRFAADRFGGIDVVVNNAGHPGKIGDPDELSLEEWETPLRVNLFGSLLCARAALPIMRARGGGQIVNVSSLTARPGFTFIRSLPYTVSKYAVEGLTWTMAVKLGDQGIRMHTFVPGLAHTRFLEGIPEGFLRGRRCQRVEHVGEPIIHLLTEDVPNGELFNAVAWLEERGRLDHYSYIHD